jgi:transcription antitermination factor NusG
LATMWHTVRVPYLSGYGFIRLAQSESREPITATRGVREVLLRPSGRLGCVADAEIDRLREGDDRRLLLPKERGVALEVGDTVRVEDGAFSGHPGRVVECDGVKTRVEVQIFGRLALAWLDRTAVEKIA